MTRYILSVLAFFYLYQAGFAQHIMAEFPSKNQQLNFQAIPFGDSILFSYDEVVGPNGRRVRDVKWISKAGIAHDIFCPVNVFAVELEGDKVYHYYREKRSLRAYEKLMNSRTMNNLPESVEFDDVIILASYVEENLFLILLKEGGNEISVLEIAGMQVVNTTTYKLPISLDDFIKKNTYVEFYDAPLLDSFKGRGRVKIFLGGSGLTLVIDESRMDATKSNPNVTHLLQLDKAGEVRYHNFPSTGKADFGSFLYDGKLFQNHIGKEKFTLLVYDLSGRQLMRYDVAADSLNVGKKESPRVNFRQGRESFQGWDNFQKIFKGTGMWDPIIVVSENGQGYRIQWGTYFDEKGLGTPGVGSPLTMMITFFVTTAITQVADGPGLSRYLYFETDLSTGKILPAEVPPLGLLRGKIDEYERSRQKKNQTPFESKSYIPFLDGVVAIYRLKPREAIGVTQLVYFD
ncbi:MAG TPA: hypothetical protein VE467_02835 [Chryseolinea sp.]|nr:hypothetical protein [Chryseolinea sp.]